MMDIEIKVYDKELKKIVSVAQIDFAKMRVSYDDLDTWSASFDDVVFMPYTGINDKNGAKIYEYDIVRTDTGDVFLVNYNRSMAAFLLRMIKQKPTGYYAKSSDVPLSGMNILMNSYELELIGNMFENDELLGGYELEEYLKMLKLN